MSDDRSVQLSIATLSWLPFIRASLTALGQQPRRFVRQRNSAVPVE